MKTVKVSMAGDQGWASLGWQSISSHPGRMGVKLGQDSLHCDCPCNTIWLPVDVANPPEIKTGGMWEKYITDAALISDQHRKLAADSEANSGLMVITSGFLGANLPGYATTPHLLLSSKCFKVLGKHANLLTKLELESTDELWHFKDQTQWVELFVEQRGRVRSVYLTWIGNAVQLWEEPLFRLYESANRQPQSNGLVDQLLAHLKLSTICSVEV